MFAHLKSHLYYINWANERKPMRSTCGSFLGQILANLPFWLSQNNSPETSVNIVI